MKFWKSEMSQALREIQDTYDEKLKSMRGDLESSCHFKVGPSAPAPLLFTHTCSFNRR